MKEYTGRYFWNVSGEVPSEEQRLADVAGTTVIQEPDPKLQSDSWRKEKGWIIRVHHAPRLALFSPLRATLCPVSEDKLTGRRKTIIQPLVPGASETVLEDDYRETAEPHRLLQDRWTGETHFEIAKEDDKPVRAAKKQKMNVQDEASPGEGASQVGTEEQHAGLFPRTELQSALHDIGPNTVDGVPAEVPGSRSMSSNACPVEDCVLPGGHDGPHLDSRNQRFQWNAYTGKMPLADESTSSESSSDEASEEEMIPDEEQKSRQSRKRTAQDTSGEREVLGFWTEIDIKPKDVQWLANHPHRATAWFSRKMQEKGKEKSWNQLTMAEKEAFDEAQAKELAQVLQSKALRSLTSQERDNLDASKVMGMRWVLTTKSTGAAKARLVVLGYQAHNITTVQSASPTMNRLSRNMLLALCANLGLAIRAGDATSAFLQADQNLEHQELHVWAPSELAVLFGAPPENPIIPLKVCRAFYGLVHAPRAWFDHLAKTLQRIGYQQLQSDKCLFILTDPATGEVVSILGMHVDDLLVGGRNGHPLFEQCFKALNEAYRWGKWEDKDFTFTGCRVRQDDKMNIYVDQEEYTNKWMDEIPISKERMHQSKSRATPQEVSDLRGAVGTVAWRASQTGPLYLADAGLLLSEIPFATVETITKANKLVREMKRDAGQRLVFHSWGRPWREIAVVAWADASQKNRPDSSSTMRIVVGLAPMEVLQGEEVGVSLVSWKSSKCPRQVLGSNGAEVQAVTEGEDMVFHTRALWCEMHGLRIQRHGIYSMVKANSHGAVVMDTRGIFDAATRNVSALHGLRSSRSGYELTVAVAQALQIGTQFRWVHGGVQLGDSLTKWNSRKVLMQFLAKGSRWVLVHDPSFESGRKVRKREIEKLIKERQDQFILAVKKMAQECRWPFDPESDEHLRSMGDACSEV